MLVMLLLLLLLLLLHLIQRRLYLDHLGHGVGGGGGEGGGGRGVHSAADAAVANCIKICLPGKLILRDYSQENMTSRRPFLLLRINFPGRLIFIQFVPVAGGEALAVAATRTHAPRIRTQTSLKFFQN